MNTRTEGNDLFKKLMSVLLAAFLVFAPVAAVAPTPVAAATLSGFHFSSSRSGGMFGGSKGSMFGGSRGSTSGGSRSSYGTGSTHTYGSPFGSTRPYGYAPRPGIGSHLFSFGAGFLLGGLFHPFGGYYGMGGFYHPFSFFNFIIDLVLIIIVVQVVRRLFWRR